MDAIVLQQAGKPLGLADIPIPVPAPGEVLIKLEAAALNHRDLWIKQGQYGQVNYPCVPGSDGSGTVVEAASDTDQNLLNKAVLINPSLSWGNNRSGPGKDFQILGVPRQGTFASYICVPAENVFPLPDGFDFIKSAALPLAGLTAHRALFYRGDLKAGQNLLITGIGGGVASFLLGFAVRAGAKVYGTSSSVSKMERSKELGALHCVNYKEEEWDSMLKELVPDGFDLVIDSAGGPGFMKLIGLLKTGGKLVTFGRTAGNIPEMSPGILFYKQISILGTTMGAPADFSGMLEFIEDHNMRPVIDKVFRLDEAEEALNYIQEGHQYGKVVMSIGDKGRE